MGKLADLVEEVEDGLTEALETIKDQDRQIEAMQDTIDELNVMLEEQAMYVDWVEQYYKEAKSNYEALQKVRGE